MMLPWEPYVVLEVYYMVFVWRVTVEFEAHLVLHSKEPKPTPSFDYQGTLSQLAILLQLKIVTSAVFVSKAKLQFLVTH